MSREPKALLPNQIFPSLMGFLVGTLGKGELEFAAACIIRYQLIKGDGLTWIPVPIEDFLEFIQADEQAREWGKNPFWRPDFIGLAQGGWIDGWVPGDMACVGTVTEKFIEAVSNPRVGPVEHQAKRRLS